MKQFFSHPGRRRTRGGFSLVESTLSIGVMSLGLISLVPLLGVGMKTSRYARDDRMTSQIAQTLVEEAKQGTLATQTVYFDDAGAACGITGSAFKAEATVDSFAAALSRVTLKVTPVGSPDRVRTYAVVFPAQQ